MAKYRITNPDGQVFEITAPDDATQDQVMTYAKANWQQAQPQAAQLETPAQPKRSMGQGAVRAAGLATRYGMEGVANAVQIVTEPLRQIVTDRVLPDRPGKLSDLVTGAAAAPKSRPLGEEATRFADWVGLPKPEDATERVVGDATRMVAGAGGMVGAGQAAAKAGARTLGGFLSANPTAQMAGAGGAGLAGGAERETGGGDGSQFFMSVLGGLAGSAAPGVAARAAGAARAAPGRLADLVNPARGMPPQQIDLQITARLEGTGVDWSAIPERVRQAVRQDVQQALKAGDNLDPQALARLVDFRTVGATPTRGSLTLDPVQVTRERNLAKTGANSSNVNAQQLTNLEADNNQTLLRRLADMGADRGADPYAVGERGIGSLQGWADQQRGNVNSLYQAARDSQGRSVPLDGSTFTREASSLLDENLLGHALPKDVERHLNRIAMGEVPFNVDYAEQLKTVIGKLQRGTSDGSTRMALGMVRRALDNATPPTGVPAASGIPNPGNLPAVTGANAAAPIEDGAIAAFNRARGANREMMQQVERTPALQALWDGDIAPDDFLRRYVTSNGAKVRDVAETVRVAGPEGRQALRDGVLGHLRQAATGGQADETARFSAGGFRRALDQLGDRKLALFFDREEIASLRALSRVAGYTSSQPVGSAVNNSNSGAMLAGKGLDLLNKAGKLGELVKLAGVGDQLNVLVRGAQQSRALNAVPSIVRSPQAERVTLRQLAAPTGKASALFATPFGPDGHDDD